MAEHGYDTTTSYNYDSTAPDIYREVHAPRLPSTHVTEKSRKQRKKENVQEIKRKISLIFSIITVFIASTVFVWGCAIVSFKQYELKEAKTEIRDLKSQVNTTKALIASSTNLDHIKTRAINELKMTEPLAHQIIYLDIAKTSYTVIEQVNEVNDRDW